MRLRDIIGLVVALVLAIGVAFLTRIFLTKEVKPKEAGQAQQVVGVVKILVAGRNLEEGYVIKAGDLAWHEWPETALEPGFMREGMVNVNSLMGSVVRVHVGQGEPVFPLDLVKPGERGILAAIVSPGMRAISIDVTPQSISSGLVSAGDYVDVILSKILTGTRQGAQSITIVKNIKVLATDVETASTHEKPKAPPHVATLEVTPAQAELITAAAKEGSLSLSLRSLAKGGAIPKKNAPEEAETSEEGEANTSHQRMVTMIRGKEKTEIQVQE